ncbi:MAG TPA: zf-TFIIB domain-containing protein [Paracoccaceae bacterium]|nr:zf-TFIIB domain-containing protein [Paracoccaceae bacterium]
MLCPVDGTTLMMSERSGVEIDYCPKCRGVWLDRGELDKILEKAAEVAPREERRDHREERREYREPRYEDRREYRDEYRPKKRESFLSDLLDF